MRLAGTTIGQFFPGESLLHRADPRSKIAAAFLFVIVLFLSHDLDALVFMAGGVAVAAAAARIPPLWIYRSLRPLLWLLIITMAFQVFMSGGEIYTRIGPVPIYRDGLYDGAFLALRLMLLVMSGTLLSFTTPPVMLTDALGSLLSPLGRIRLPVNELSLMVTMALRFIPTLLMEVERIIKAQRARGVLDSGRGPLARARSLMPVLIPMFVLSFRHADELAEAMESRCWRGGRGRTHRRKLRLGKVDALLFGVLVVFLGTSLWLGGLW